FVESEIRNPKKKMRPALPRAIAAPLARRSQLVEPVQHHDEVCRRLRGSHHHEGLPITRHVVAAIDRIVHVVPFEQLAPGAHGERLSDWLARNGCAVRGPCSDNVWIERTGPPPPDRNSSVRPSGVTSPAHWSSGATSSNSAGPEPSAGIQDKSPWPNWPRE